MARRAGSGGVWLGGLPTEGYLSDIVLNLLPVICHFYLASDWLDILISYQDSSSTLNLLLRARKENVIPSLENELETRLC